MSKMESVYENVILIIRSTSNHDYNYFKYVNVSKDRKHIQGEIKNQVDTL